MKLIKKIKKCIIGIGVFFLTFYHKVLGTEVMQPDYGVPISGKEWFLIIWSVINIIIVPIVLLLGLVTYFKKSKSSTKKKIIISILAVTLAISMIFIVRILNIII